MSKNLKANAISRRNFLKAGAIIGGGIAAGFPAIYAQDRPVSAAAAAASKAKVTAEQAAQIVKDDGTFNYDVLGQIISDKETAAAKAKEEEIANNSHNPNGSNGSYFGKF